MEGSKEKCIVYHPEYISTAICSSLPAMGRGIEVIEKDKPIVFILFVANPSALMQTAVAVAQRQDYIKLIYLTAIILSANLHR